jgi:tetratricopeptide (TPR) repeat protein
MKRVQAVFLLSLLLVGVSLQGYAASREELNPYQAGISALTAGDAQKAVDLLTQAIADNPHDHRSYNDRGVAYKRCGNLESALSDYSKAIELKPGYTQALNNRGLVYVEQGLYDKAILDFSEALKHGGLQSKIYTNIGLTRAKQGDHLAAIKDFDKAFSYRPLDYRSFVFMAESLEKTGEKERALKTYQLARGLVNENQTKEIIETKIAALEKDTASSKTSPATISSGLGDNMRPGFEEGSRLGQQHEKRPGQIREIARAKPFPEMTIAPRKTAPESEKAAMATVEALDRVSRTKATEKLAPASAEIYRQGLQFLDKSEKAKALVRFEDTRLLERRNKNVFAVAWSDMEIGRIHSKMGDHVRAEAYFGEALRLFESLKAGDQAILAFIELAVLHQQAGRKEKASLLFSKARERAVLEGHQLLGVAIGDMAEGRSVPEKTKLPVDRRTQSDATSTNQNAQPSAGETTSKPGKQHTAVKGRQDAAFPSRRETQPPSLDENQIEPRPEIANKSKPQSVDKIESVRVTRNEPVKILRDSPSDVSLPPARNSVSNSGAVLQSPRQRVFTGAGEFSKLGRLVDANAQPGDSNAGKVRIAGVEPSPAGKHSSLEKLAGRGSQSSPGILETGDKDSYEKVLRRDLAELKELRKKNDEQQMIVVLERLSERFVQRRNFDKALHSVSAALALREKHLLYKQIERALQMRGSVREILGHSAEALEDYTRAMAVSESGDRRLVSNLEQRSRKIAAALGLDARAILDAFKLLWKARAEGDTLGETQALFGIGRTFDKAERNSDALSYYERSSASMLVNRARVFEKMGKEQLAHDYYAQALEILRNLDYSGYINIMRKAKIAGNLSQN